MQKQTEKKLLRLCVGFDPLWSPHRGECNAWLKLGDSVHHSKVSIFENSPQKASQYLCEHNMCTELRPIQVGLAGLYLISVKC